MTKTATVFQILQNLIQWLTSLIWTSETTSTVELGKCTGTNSSDVKKPPLHPSKKKVRRRQIPAVLYLDPDYWDARMVDVED
jgi:hypothetical protein